MPVAFPDIAEHNKAGAGLWGFGAADARGKATLGAISL